ncbi:MAG: hypothetical protein ACPGSO_05725 [Vicingaceae bacterium]
MNPINEILHEDGSCRDINFDREVSQKNLLHLIVFLNQHWEFKSLTDFEVKFEKLNLIDEELPESFQAFWTKGTMIKELQLYAFKEKTGNYFLELTFFPQDLNKIELTLNTLTVFLTNLQRITQSEKIFLRYENASWKYGEITPDVILSHLDL